MIPLQPTLENLTNVAQELRQGKLAVLPTETVYGLAADASNSEAVAAIFALKGRPAENPLIVHVSSIDQIEHFAASIPESVSLLAAAFMPGPLTIVLPKKPHVPDVLTGGLSSVAIRMPDHPACLAVMEIGELSLAMPSANPFMGLSPTNVNMIDPSLLAGISSILDGGPCTLGIESTVLDLAGEPTVLRPGSITREEIETVLKLHVGEGSSMRKAPGMYKRHYAPRAQCQVVVELSATDAGLVFGPPQNEHQIQMPKDPRAYAGSLYASMADLDGRGLSEFFIELPPIVEGWTAVMDRLVKATS